MSRPLSLSSLFDVARAVNNRTRRPSLSSSDSTSSSSTSTTNNGAGTGPDILNADEEQTEAAHREGSLWSIILKADRPSLLALLSKAHLMDNDEGFTLLSSRGPVGELALHMCFLYNSDLHRELGWLIMERFPMLISECYNGSEYLGENILHIAIINRDFDTVRQLVDIEPKLIHARATGHFFSRGQACYYGEYPIFFAACTNQFHMVEFLLNKGADLNVVDSNGNTILHVLVINNLMEIYMRVKQLWINYYRGKKKHKEREREKEKENDKQRSSVSSLTQIDEEEIDKQVESLREREMEKEREKEREKEKEKEKEKQRRSSLGKEIETLATPADTDDETSYAPTSSSSSSSSSSARPRRSSMISRLKQKVQSASFKVETEKLKENEKEMKTRSIIKDDSDIKDNSQEESDGTSHSSSATDSLSPIELSLRHLKIYRKTFPSRFEYIPCSSHIEPWNRLNKDKFSPLTLAAYQGNFESFSFLLEENKQMQWTYGPVSCFIYPLEQIDTNIENEEEETTAPLHSVAHHENKKDKEKEKSSATSRGPGALELIINQAHVPLLMHPRIIDLIQKKWEKFGQRIFFQRFFIVLVYLITFSITTIARQTMDNHAMGGFSHGHGAHSSHHHSSSSSASSSHPHPRRLRQSSSRAQSILDAGVSTGLLDNFDALLYEIWIDPIRWYDTVHHYPCLLFAGEFFVIGGAIYKGYKEFNEMMIGGGVSAYFSTKGSALLENCISLLFVLSIVISTLLSLADSPWERTIMSFASIFGWVYLFFFLLAFRLTGPMVVMVIRMLSGDVLRFLFIYAVFLMGFTSSFFILFDNFGFEGLVHSFRSVFMATLGKFELDEYIETQFFFLSVTQLIVFVLIVTILLLNLLIAMMGNTYNNINEHAIEQWNLERARIIFSIEHELDNNERLKNSFKYWTNIGGKRFLQVMVNNEKHFKTLNAIDRKNKKKIMDQNPQVQKQEMHSSGNEGKSNDDRQEE